MRLSKWLLAGVLVAVLNGGTMAQDKPSATGVVRWPGGDLYAQANSSSDKLASVSRGEKVEFIKHEGLWTNVRWQGKEGWISRIFLEWRTEAPAAAATPLPTAAGPSRGRAVLFGISRYQAALNITTLEGVPHDMQSARAMAQLMGITTDRITVIRDDEASKAAIAAQLAQLAKDAIKDEPILVYYSGHGGRIADPEEPKRCIEGLIAHDGQLFTATEMAELLRPLARISDDLFVFFDSCHSGGLSATRALGRGRLKPKFVARGDVSNCTEIVNVLRTPPTGTRSTGKPYVYVAAARADEVSLDDPKRGGLATANFLRCMVEGNSRQSVEALRACAQKGIDGDVAGSSNFKPPHLSITGDLSVVPVRVSLSAKQKQQLLAQATQASGSERQAGKNLTIAAQKGLKGWPAVSTPHQAFEAIVARADRSTELKVQAPTTMQIDRDALRLEIEAPSDGYLYLFQASSDSQSAVMLFPNLNDRDNRIAANKPIRLPSASWPLVAGGPVGTSELLIVFSRVQRDIGQLAGQESGPFLDLTVTPTGLQSLILAISRSAFAGTQECRSPATTNLACDSKFVATRKLIKETETAPEAAH